MKALKKTFFLVVIFCLIWIICKYFINLNDPKYYNSLNPKFDNWRIQKTIEESEATVLLYILNGYEKENWNKLPITKSFLNKCLSGEIEKDKFINFFYDSDTYRDYFDYQNENEKMFDPSRYIHCEGKILDENEYNIYGKGEGMELYKYVYKLDIIQVTENRKELNGIKLIEKYKVYERNGEISQESLYRISKDRFYWYIPVAIFPESYFRDQMEYEPYIGTLPLCKTRRNIALTDNFLYKYGYDEDIIVFNTPAYVKPESFYCENMHDFEKKEIVIKEELPFEFKIVYIKFRFTINDNYYLDEVEEISREEIPNFKRRYDMLNDIGNNDEETIRFISIKNSNWKNLYTLSDKFKSKYNNVDGIFPSYDVSQCVPYVLGKNHCILRLKNGENKICYYKFEKDGIWINDVYIYIYKSINDYYDNPIKN